MAQRIDAPPQVPHVSAIPLDDNSRLAHHNSASNFPVATQLPPNYDQFCHMAFRDDQPCTRTYPAGDWLIDSSATNHYTSRYELLQNFRPLKDIPILTGKGYIFARGIVILTFIFLLVLPLFGTFFESLTLPV